MSVHIFKYGAGEMAQQFRVLIALAEDPGSVPTTLMVDRQLLVTPAPGDPMPLTFMRTALVCSYSHSDRHRPVSANSKHKCS